MTKILIAAVAGLVAGLSAAPEAPAPRAADRVAVVVDASGPGTAARLAAARATAARRHADLRAPRSLHEQVTTAAALSVRGYRTIIGYGLEADAAIAPLHGSVRYIDAG
jgi:hypothetical protein